MNPRTIVILFALITSIAAANAALNCCEATCTEFDGDPAVLQCPDPVTPGSCSVISSCNDDGCCCEADGSADIMDHYACSIASGSFTSGVTDPATCSEICGTGAPITESDCDSDFMNSFAVTGRVVPGEPTIELSWPLCTDITGVEIWRRTASTPLSLVEAIGMRESYTDSGLAWSTNYLYEVRLKQTSAADITDTTQVSTGDDRCADSDGGRFCVGDTLRTCNANNVFISDQTCPGGCTDTGLGATCTGAAGACEITYPYLNVANATACEAIDDAACYYDRSETGINGCYDCASVTSCYDFKSSYACDRANEACGLFPEGCTWQATGAGLGDGICKPNDENRNICTFITSPAGNVRQELYSPLLSITSHATSSTWYSTPQFSCGVPGTTCVASPESTCTDTLTGTGQYDCDWRGSYCGKVGGTQPSPYFLDSQIGFLCPDDPASTCEQDTIPPTLSVTRTIDWDAKTVIYTPTVRDPNVITDLTDYTFSICYGGPDASCTPQNHIITEPDSTGRFVIPFGSFDVENAPVSTTFSAVVRDPGFNVGNLVSITATIDPTSPNPQLTITPIPGTIDGDSNTGVRATASWNGAGTGTVTIGSTTRSISNGETLTIEGDYSYGEQYSAVLSVERAAQTYTTDPVTFTLTEPSFYITITSPPPSGGIPPSGALSIAVTSSRTAQSCRYELTTSQTPPSSHAGHSRTMSGSSTSWTASATYPSNGYLHVSCLQSGTRTDQKSLKLHYVPSTTPPTILKVAVTPGRTLVFADDDGTYRATFNVTTNRPTTCRAGTVNSGTTPSIDNTLALSFTGTGERTVSIVCTDAIGQQTAPRSETITVSPSGTWYGFVEPTGTFRAARVPYRIATGSSGLTAQCSIPLINLNAQGTDINGTFKPTDFDWYEGDGTYTLEATCTGWRGAVGTGDATPPTKQTATFTIDNSPPSVEARINGLSSRIELEAIPTNPFVRIIYSDDSPISSITYRLEATTGASWTLVENETITENLQTSGTLTRFFDVDLEDQTEYRVHVRIEDGAGNWNETTSNRLIITLPDPCENPDVCGGACGATCDIGDACTTSADCKGGAEAVCTDAGVCGYSHCFNGVIDEAKGETGPDCGGACGACTISLVEPSFGVTATQQTRVVVNTTEGMDCTWSTGGAPFEFNSVSSNKRTHTITRVDVTVVPSINVSCNNDQKNEWKLFALSHDPRRPEIEFWANPDIEGRKSVTPDGPAYATTFTARSTNDVEILCRHSMTDEAYAKMTSYLGEDYTTDLDETSYRASQNELFAFKDAGTYRVYVDCIGKNGLTSGPQRATFIADPDAKPTPMIVVPMADRVYSNETLVSVVDARSIQARSCMSSLEDFEMRPMTLSRDTIYERSINLNTDGRLSYSALCEYEVGTLLANGTSSLRFVVDRTPPEIESVVIRDPNTKNTTTTSTPNGIEFVIIASDETTYLSRYEYTISVNGVAASNGTRLVNRFSDNTLELGSGDRISATVKVYDSLNNVASETSNTLTFVQTTPPEGACDDTCGGECDPCEDVGDTCAVDTDCAEDLYCASDDTCQDKDDICSNGEFDAGYETAKDCGGICEPCESGGACTTHDDCTENEYCASDRTCKLDYQAICTNGKHDTKYEAGTDCGDVCESMFAKACAVGSACNTNADCDGNAICKGGVCTNEFTTPTNPWCTTNTFNNTINATSTKNATFCGRGCAEQCPEGVGCRLSTDCASGLTCDEGTCAKPAPPPPSCIPTDPSPPPCGGDCTLKCTSARMCEAGSDCLSGNCVGGYCAGGSTDTGETTDPSRVTPRGGLDEACNAGGTCDDGLTCNDDNLCVEKRSPWRWIIFFLLLVLLGVAGFIAYWYYLRPNQKPDYLEGQTMESETANAAFDASSAETSVSPPAAPPVMTEKQQHVSELIREKRVEAREQERSELLSAFDDSALDDPAPSPDDVPKTPIPKAQSDEKPVVPTRKKSHESFKEIIDEAKDGLE